MRVLKANRGIVIRGSIPQATTGDLNALVLHLPDGNLHDNLITRNVQRRLALLLDFIGNVLAERLKLIAKVRPFLDPLFVDFSFEFSLEDFLGDEPCLGGVELVGLLGCEMIGWQDYVCGLK